MVRVALLLCAPLLAAAAAAVSAPRGHREALVQDGKGKLSPKELAGINSVACLKARQKDPSASCEEFQGGGGSDDAMRGVVTPAMLGDQVVDPDEKSEPPPPEHFGIGDWPHWSDKRCNSHGEFLCDPGGALDPEAQHRVAGLLKSVREQVTVKCRILEAKLAPTGGGPCDPTSVPTSTRPFNLGVVVASEWPQSEADAGTLQKFGQLVLNDWGLMPIYNGVDTRNAVDPPGTWEEYTANCPNSALLILLPAYGQVILSAPSCEFICSDRGGPEVTVRVQHALDSEVGLEKAISAGVEEVRAVLETAQRPLSMEGQGAWRQRFNLRDMLKDQKKFESTERAWTVTLRVALVGILALTAFSLAAFLHYNMDAKPMASRLARSARIM
jgi:hypothetical protein